MATLFLFVLGLVLITLLARYNESNKLFWVLFTGLMLGITAHVIVNDMSTGKESNATVMSVEPTQALAVAPTSLVYLLVDEPLLTTVKATSKPVSKAIPMFNESSVTLSDVSGVTKGPYLHILPNPPNVVNIVDDS